MIGLVSMCVEDEQLQSRALEVARRLAEGPPSAIRWTKRTLHLWLKQAWPIFEAALAYEMIGFGGPEVQEGLAAHMEKRPAQFDKLDKFPI